MISVAYSLCTAIIQNSVAQTFLMYERDVSQVAAKHACEIVACFAQSTLYV